MASDIMAHMNSYGRVACCGAITGFHSSGPVQGKSFFPLFFLLHGKKICEVYT